MKKLLTDWEWLSIRVLILGITVFLWSYITEIDGVLEVFGDWDEEMSWGTIRHHWGFRHWVYTVTFAILTGIQAVRIIKWATIRSDKKGFEIKNQD